MKVLIVGAGATYAEALNLQAPNNFLPPLMNNLARCIWKNFNPHPYLDEFLTRLGYEINNEDGRQVFYELEQKGRINIEKFFEFCWLERERSWSLSNNPKVNKKLNIPNFGNASLPRDFIMGLRISTPDNGLVHSNAEEINFWDNMLCHGFGIPFQMMMITCFFENGKGFKDLALTKKVIAKLQHTDVVVNLNYDTVFELAIKQAGLHYVYCPNLEVSCIKVCKPHGSLNMVINTKERCFSFGDPEWLGTPEPQLSTGLRSFSGFIPPRLNKTYEQNPASKMMIDSIKHVAPNEISFWGVGLTESDVDLISLFRGWLTSDTIVKVINPNRSVCDKFKKALSHNVHHYKDVDAWLAG